MKLAYCLPLLLSLLTACAAPGDTPSQQRGAIQAMRSDTLGKLYKLKPEVRKEIRSAAGYAVFSNINNNLLFVSSGNGYGVAHDNRSGKDTYMKMASVGVGLGLGIKDFQAVILFKDRAAFTQFLEQGWDANVQADAAAKSGGQGDAVGLDQARGVGDPVGCSVDRLRPCHVRGERAVIRHLSRRCCSTRRHRRACQPVQVLRRRARVRR